MVCTLGPSVCLSHCPGGCGKMADLCLCLWSGECVRNQPVNWTAPSEKSRTHTHTLTHTHIKWNLLTITLGIPRVLTRLALSVAATYAHKSNAIGEREKEWERETEREKERERLDESHW